MTKKSTDTPVEPGKMDARKLSRQELKSRRELVVRLREECVPVMQIVEQTGLSWSAVNTALKLHANGGVQALNPSARGRRQGTGRILTPHQEADVRMKIRTKRPMNFGLKKFLWCSETACQMVRKKYEVTISQRTMDSYLSNWKITFPRSLSDREPSCVLNVKRYLVDQLKKIKELAKENNSEIWFLNDPFVLPAHYWNQISRKIQFSTEREVVDDGRSRRMLSVVNLQGKLKWIVYAGNLSAAKQIRFFKALIKDSHGKKVYLINSRNKKFENKNLSGWIKDSELTFRIFPPIGEVFEKSRRKATINSY